MAFSSSFYTFSCRHFSGLKIKQAGTLNLGKSLRRLSLTFGENGLLAKLLYKFCVRPPVVWMGVQGREEIGQMTLLPGDTFGLCSSEKLSSRLGALSRP